MAWYISALFSWWIGWLVFLSGSQPAKGERFVVVISPIIDSAQQILGLIHLNPPLPPFARNLWSMPQKWGNYLFIPFMYIYHHLVSWMVQFMYIYHHLVSRMEQFYARRLKSSQQDDVCFLQEGLLYSLPLFIHFRGIVI